MASNIPLVSEIRERVLHDDALEALAKAHSVPVQWCSQAHVSYYPSPSHDPPVLNYTSGFQEGDFIHFKQVFNPSWCIGRVIGAKTGMFFLPSEEKLQELLEQRLSEDYPKSLQDKISMYQPVALMRPIVVVGPSSKESQLSELLQKPLISFMREQFSGRLATVKPAFSVQNLTRENASRLESNVYRAGVSLNLVLLESDASFPSQFEDTSLHPIFVYIQVSRKKVLEKLLKEYTANARDRETQLKDAFTLYNSNPMDFSLIIHDSNVRDALQRLELFLESYWAATRSVLLNERFPQEQQH